MKQNIRKLISTLLIAFIFIGVVPLQVLADTATPTFCFDIFNNGESGSPSRPNADLEAVGYIRMRTRLDGVVTPIPLELSDTITAYDQDGNNAIAFTARNSSGAQITYTVSTYNTVPFINRPMRYLGPEHIGELEGGGLFFTNRLRVWVIGDGTTQEVLKRLRQLLSLLAVKLFGYQDEYQTVIADIVKTYFT